MPICTGSPVIVIDLSAGNTPMFDTVVVEKADKVL